MGALYQGDPGWELSIREILGGSSPSGRSWVGALHQGDPRWELSVREILGGSSLSGRSWAGAFSQGNPELKYVFVSVPDEGNIHEAALPL